MWRYQLFIGFITWFQGLACVLNIKNLTSKKDKVWGVICSLISIAYGTYSTKQAIDEIKEEAVDEYLEKESKKNLD